MRHKCKSCGVAIGTGCGCCPWDFPEESGYCAECYPNTDEYRDQMQLLWALLDRIDIPAMEILRNFIKEFDAEHERSYLLEIMKRINEVEELQKTLDT